MTPSQAFGILATVYGGPDMAARIVKCVNDAARRGL